MIWQSREVEGARAPTTDAIDDATEDCAEFEVGPVIGDLQRAQNATRSTKESCFWIGTRGMSRA